MVKLYENFKKNNLMVNIYLIGIFLLCLKFFSERNILINWNDSIIALLLTVCFIVKMISQKYSIKQLIITIISGVISIYVAFITKEYVLFYFYLALFASKDVELNKIIKVSFYSLASLLILLTVVYVVKMLIGMEIPIISRNDGRLRYSFYLNHPNIYAGIVLWLSAMVLYLKYNNIKIWHYFIIIAINLFVFYFTDSRTSFMAFGILIVLFIIFKNTSGLHKYYKYIAKYMFLLLGCVTILLSVMYLIDKENIIVKTLNELFSQRIFLFAKAIEMFGISLLPRNLDLTQKIIWESGAVRELYIDSIYARAVIKYGILYLIYLFYICSNLINKKTTIKEVTFVIMFSIIAMMEKYLILPVIGFSLFFYKDYLWNGKGKENIGIWLKKKKIDNDEKIENLDVSEFEGNINQSSINENNDIDESKKSIKKNSKSNIKPKEKTDKNTNKKMNNNVIEKRAKKRIGGISVD